jgi:hypothetical protein
LQETLEEARAPDEAQDHGPGQGRQPNQEIAATVQGCQLETNTRRGGMASSAAYPASSPREQCGSPITSQAASPVQTLAGGSMKGMNKSPPTIVKVVRVL